MSERTGMAGLPEIGKRPLLRLGRGTFAAGGQEHAEPSGACAGPDEGADHDGPAIERLFVELFLDAHQKAPRQIVLDLDATDDPLHGHQEGRFFHGYYDCYCYLPLYVFCGRHLLPHLSLFGDSSERLCQTKCSRRL